VTAGWGQRSGIFLWQWQISAPSRGTTYVLPACYTKLQPALTSAVAIECGVIHEVTPYSAISTCHVMLPCMS
jgi:hypothetical protein